MHNLIREKSLGLKRAFPTSLYNVAFRHLLNFQHQGLPIHPLLGKWFVSIYLSIHLYCELSSDFAEPGKALISLQFRQRFRDCARKGGVSVQMEHQGEHFTHSHNMIL